MSLYPIASLSDEELSEIPIHSLRNSFFQRKYTELRYIREQILLQNWLHQNASEILSTTKRLEDEPNYEYIPREVFERAIKKNLKQLYPLFLVQIMAILEEITDTFVYEVWDEEEKAEVRSLVYSSRERGANLFDFLLLGKGLSVYNYIHNRQDFEEVLHVLAEAKEVRNQILHPQRGQIPHLTTEDILNIWRSAVRFLLFTNAVAKPSILHDLRQRLAQEKEK
ncbi:MAG: hypothetical protein NZM25_05820 [Leptospiraceae bacterium]|nr:hypothetical protein [Leptospiraceae bacterium]MDW8306707.1 hypothetical protein [Leptospiraceae bacterium]